MSYPGNTPRPEPFKPTVEAELLYMRLIEVAEDEVVTYAELSAIAGIPVVGATSKLRTARQRCQRNLSAIFVAINGIGLRRLVPGAVVERAGQHHTRRLHRATKRAGKELDTTDGRQELTLEQQREKFIYRGKFREMQRATRHTTAKREVAAVEYIDGRFVQVERAKQRAAAPPAPPTEPAEPQ